MIIYKATNKINSKIYIGQTIKPLEERKNGHKNSYKHKAAKHMVFSRAIKKYGFENFEWEIIDVADNIFELNEKESYWILKLDSIVDNHKGYNANYGGGNKKHSELTKTKIGFAHKGEKNFFYNKSGIEHPTSKPVYNVTDGILYENATQCANNEKLSYSHLCGVCRGKRASTSNKIYRYVDKDGNIIDVECEFKKKSRTIVNIDTGEKFMTAKDAELFVNKKGNLSNFLNKNNGVAFWSGYAWRYEDIEDYVYPVKKSRSDAKKVRNITTNDTFNSLNEAANSINRKDYRNLATALRLGDGKCIWGKQTWELIKF